MGVFGWGRSHRSEGEQSQGPDPSNWVMVRSISMKPFLIVEVLYPDCKNYEGKKIMVFNTTLSELRGQLKIDPHFGQENNMIYPIARFQPTEEGWNDAYNYVVFKKVLEIVK